MHGKDCEEKKTVLSTCTQASSYSPQCQPLHSWSDNSKEVAVDAVKSGRKGVNRVALKFSVPHTTLEDRLRGRVMHGTKSVPKPSGPSSSCSSVPPASTLSTSNCDLPPPSTPSTPGFSESHFTPPSTSASVSSTPGSSGSHLHPLSTPSTPASVPSTPDSSRSHLPPPSSPASVPSTPGSSGTHLLPVA